MQDLRQFLGFFQEYTKHRFVAFGRGFENVKNIIVAFLVVKRGKYSSSFLNTSFIILIVSAFVAGPAITENNPFIGSLEQSPKYQEAVVSYNPYKNPLGTVESAKIRSSSVKYEVKGGDTIAAIAQKFDVSTDTIKWANNLKADTIKPGQELNIPPVTGVVHKVNSGESIYSIAKKYNTNPQKIADFWPNDFADLETFALIPGQVLYVPDGVIPPEQPRYVARAPQYAPIQAGARGTSNFIWPTSGSISQGFAGYHPAIDIENRAAPTIIAADGGSVVFSGCVGFGYGCHVVVDHGNGFQTLYAHMSALSVSAGTAVSQGQQLGVMGCTGRCTGTHLHFEIHQGGGAQNPLGFLR